MRASSQFDDTDRLESRKRRGVRIAAGRLRSWQDMNIEIIRSSDRVLMMESSILAQNERWRRVLSMQVER